MSGGSVPKNLVSFFTLEGLERAGSSESLISGWDCDLTIAMLVWVLSAAISPLMFSISCEYLVVVSFENSHSFFPAYPALSYFLSYFLLCPIALDFVTTSHWITVLDKFVSIQLYRIWETVFSLRQTRFGSSQPSKRSKLSLIKINCILQRYVKIILNPSQRVSSKLSVFKSLTRFSHLYHQMLRPHLRTQVCHRSGKRHYVRF